MSKRNTYLHFLFCSLLFGMCNSIFSQPVKQIYNYTGVPQTYTVPCTDTITVKAWGGGGSGGGADDFGGAVGGAGAFVQSSFAVTPGQVLTIIIGGGAGPGGNHVAWTGGGAAGPGRPRAPPQTVAHPDVVAHRGAGRGRDSGSVDVFVESPQTALKLRPDRKSV